MIQADPEFLEAHYRHVIHCASTQRDEEGRQVLQALLEKADRSGTIYEYLGRLKRELPNFPKFWPQAQELLSRYESRLAGQPFEFKQGRANDITDLAQLCDRFPEEAQKYLMGGRFERWLDARGKAPLAEEAQRIVKKYETRPDRALEMFVRAMYRDLNREPEGLPRLRPDPPQVKWRQLPVGAIVQTRIRLTREGRGHIWGTIQVEGLTKDLKWTPAFDQVPASIDLALDTARYEPGTYRADLIIQPEGLAPTRVPLSWEVIPLEVALQPGHVDFGRVVSGLQTAEARLECRTPGGRLLVDQAVPDPPVPGLQVETHVRNGTPVVVVRWDTNALEAGRLYQTKIRISTNVGTWNLPVSALRGIPWAVIWARAIGLGAVVGLLLSLVRTLWMPDEWVWRMGDLSPLFDPDRWKGPIEATVERLAIGGGLILFLIGLRIYWIYKNKKQKT